MWHTVYQLLTKIALGIIIMIIKRTVCGIARQIFPVNIWGRYLNACLHVNNALTTANYNTFLERALLGRLVMRSNTEADPSQSNSNYRMGV